jgi:hypothetical protein
MGWRAMPSTAEKVARFRRLFGGRADLFPVRWENRATAKSGYASTAAAMADGTRGCVGIFERELLPVWRNRLVP